MGSETCGSVGVAVGPGGDKGLGCEEGDWVSGSVGTLGGQLLGWPRHY